MENYTYLYLFNPPNNSLLSTAVVDSAMQLPESYQPSASASVSSGSAAERVWHTCMVDSYHNQHWSNDSFQYSYHALKCLLYQRHWIPSWICSSAYSGAEEDYCTHVQKSHTCDFGALLIFFNAMISWRSLLRSSSKRRRSEFLLSCKSSFRFCIAPIHYNIAAI